MLDAFAGIDPGPIRLAWAARAGAGRALDEARAALAAAARDRDWLAHASAELDAFDPRPDEEPALDLRRRQLRAADRIREDVTGAAEALGPEGAEGALLGALRRLEAAARNAEGALDPALDAMSRVLGELAEVSRAVDLAASNLDADPGELDRVEERLFALRGLARKHQVAPDALPALAEALRARLRALDDGEVGLGRLVAALDVADAAYGAAASAIAVARREAATRLDARMARELKPLKLERATFATEIAEGEPGPEGRDRVRFAVATNPGAPAGPLERIASGGELSRFLLALKVCLSTRSPGLTLIFDEIDRGVGGATADAVGRRLQALGEAAQVLVVTHSPQVAARGAWHWQVGKAVRCGATRTQVADLAAPERVEEIARMLAGDTVTDEARAAARALLDG